MESNTIHPDKIKSLGKDPRIVISGGGSGGHVFPAIAIANQLKEFIPDADIKFIGATGKIEMKKVPLAGYSILGLPIRGLQRRFTLQNLTVPFRLVYSMLKAFSFLRKFKPLIAIGVGGYASFPTLYMASVLGIKTLIQEQNSHAGVANKLLRNRADKFCVAYENMDKYFSKEKIVYTGNPVRTNLADAKVTKEAAKILCGLDPKKPTVLLTGGSLGARNLNDAMEVNCELIAANPEVQWYWQVGSLYEERFLQMKTANLPNVKMVAFIDRMDLAYKIADILICRAGALTISEICLLGKSAILVPSPNVAEDHQTKNALALAEKKAAVLVKDSEAQEKMVATALNLLKDISARMSLEKNAKALGRPEATKDIVATIVELIGDKS